jgi:hypothetical protein
MARHPQPTVCLNSLRLRPLYSATPHAEGGSRGQATALACDTPSSEVGGGTAAKQPPECEAVATEPECGGSAEQSRSAQRPPLDDYAYCYSLMLDTRLKDYEMEIAEAAREYESASKKEACRSGWLKPQDYCFSPKGSLAWMERREGADRRNQVAVPVRLPIALPRKSVSSSSGQLTACALRYRRLMTSYIRGLYFSPLSASSIRQRTTVLLNQRRKLQAGSGSATASASCPLRKL